MRITRKQKIYMVISIIMLAWVSIFIVINSQYQSFWSDEMSTIGYIRTGMSPMDVIKGYLLTDAVNLPFYPLIVYVVYRIFPFGEVYLLLPSILFTILTIILIARLVYLCLGEDCAFIALCFATISQNIFYVGAWDIRCYSLLMLCTTICLILYVKRLKNENYKYIIWYGIAMLVLFNVHWFGPLLMLYFAFQDLILWIRKKIGFRCIISYLLAGGCFLPMAIYCIFGTNRDLSTNHSKAVELKSIFETVSYLVGGRFLVSLLFIAGVALIVLIFIFSKKIRSSLSELMMFIGSIVWSISIVFIYCKWINPKGSFYEHRYFMVLIPQTIMILSYTIKYIIDLAKKVINLVVKNQSVCKVLFGVVCVLFMAYFAKYFVQNYKELHVLATDERMPYGECAEYLSEEGSIYDNNCLVITAETTNLTEAWLDYYFDKRGARRPENIVASIKNRDVDQVKTWREVEDITQYDKIVVFFMSFPVEIELEEKLQEKYTVVDSQYNNRVRIFELTNKEK